MHELMPLCLFLDPDSPPVNVIAQVLSPTSIVVTWNEVPPINQNGEIIGYDLIYEPLETFSGAIELTRVNNLPASSPGLTLHGLEEYVSYNISVSASTQVGSGPFSIPLTAVTDEAGKYVMHNYVQIILLKLIIMQFLPVLLVM